MINEPVEVTLLVTRQLEALQIPYLIGGSVASIICDLPSAEAASFSGNLIQ